LSPEEKEIWKSILRQHAGITDEDQTANMHNLQQVHGFLSYLSTEKGCRDKPENHQIKANNILTVTDKMQESFARACRYAQLQKAIVERQKEEIEELKTELNTRI
jgi:hypothetical protein